MMSKEAKERLFLKEKALKIFRSQDLTLSISGTEITIQTSSREDAEIIFNWLEDQSRIRKEES